MEVLYAYWQQYLKFYCDYNTARPNLEVPILYSQRNLSDRLSITPRGILHVGAHLAEEARTYEVLLADNLGKTIWIESQSDKCETLRQALDPKRNVVIEATIWDKSNQTMTFYETSNSESSRVNTATSSSVL